MSRRGNTHRRDIKSMSFRRENRYAYLDQDADMDNQNLRYGDDRQADIEDSPQGSGCLPRVFNRGRSHQQSSGGSYSQTGRGGGGGGGGGGSGKSFLRRLGLPVGQGRGGGGNSGTGQRGGRGGRKFVENNKNAMMRSSTGGQHTGPLINMVKIPQGRMFGKEFIFRSLSAYVEGDLKPMLFKFSDTGDAIFYLEDNDVTQAVKAANRRISDPKTGSRMIVITSKVAPLWAPLPTNEFQLIKQVMGKRYNETTRVLDLSQFGLDPIFKAANFHASLQRNNVMMAVVQLVDEYFGQVRCIDLSGNRLRFLDYLANLVARTKHVQALNLANNQIDQPLELEKLHGWPLIELTLEGNMFCSRFGADGNAYKSAVHKVFPKVTLLDGVPVSPEIGFALDEEDKDVKTVPSSKPGFYVNDNLRGLIESFVIEYFTQYDGPDPEATRKHLMAAYDDQALFTLTIEPIGEGSERAMYSDSAMFKEYRQDSHNVLMMDKWERYRAKIVQKGSLNVVSRLCRLPKTEHLKDTFLVDVSFASDNLMCFTLQGLFRDGDNAGTNSEELRFFARTFLVVPRGEGKIAVVNEQLYISALTAGHAKLYYVQLNKSLQTPQEPVALSSANPAVINQQPPQMPNLSMAPPAAAAAVSREQLLAQFSQESGLKPEWAEKCLADHDYNYERAGSVFMELKRMGKIPQEAFH